MINLSAQDPAIDATRTELIESFVENLEREGEFDINDIYDQLLGFLETPLDLNLADEATLNQSELFSPLQVQSILNHRHQYGDFISIYELQTIRDFNMRFIRSLIPFVTVTSKLENFHVSIPRMMHEGKNEIITRVERFLQQKKGFQTGVYAGDQNRLLFRYQHRYENRLSYGITAEKDAGEDFFRGSNPQGFDYYSAHFYLSNYSSKLKSLAIGDYYLRLGQGLVMYNGFSSGKSAFTANIKRGGKKVQAYRSISESQYLRGIATTIALNSKLSITPFVSFKKRDANVFVHPDDTLDVIRFSSIQQSGNHRTINEIQDERAISESIYGVNLQSYWKRFNIGLTGVHTRYSDPLIRNITLQNQFDITGDRFTNLSIDYAGNLRNLHFFGETARSNNGAYATTNGLLVGLARRAHLSLLYRNFAKNYWSIYSDPFANSTRPQNEEGLYVGLHIEPIKKISIDAYADTWSHSWLRFGTNAPSGGKEYLVRIRYYKKRTTELYVQLKRKTRERNLIGNIEPVRQIGTEHRTQFRIHFSQKLSKALEWRNRIEWIRYSLDQNTPTNGFLIYQDFIFKPLSFPLSFTSRFAIFDTEDFNSRIYAYENDILYSFFIPAYFEQGMRYYLNLRYRPVSAWTFELRFEESFLARTDSFGSGNELIQGNKRSKVKFQLRYQF